MEKKKFIIALIGLLIFLPSAAFCDVIHEINSRSNSIEINSTLILRSGDLIDFWNLSVSLPENATLEKIEDEEGPINNYELSGENLQIKTNQRKARIRIINIYYSIKQWKKIQDINIIELSLFGFVNDSSFIKIRGNLPYVFVHGAKAEYMENETRARKTGPASITLIYGGEKESQHYFTNSPVNLSELEKIYPIIEKITGLKVPVKFGIVLLSQSDYERDYKDWSAGTFNGLILVKDAGSKEDLIATAIHETTHGFNSFALSWDNTNISWFDEGTASYATSIAYRLLNKTQPEIFGEDITWVDENYIYSLKPKKIPEDLWNYYHQKQNYMYYWYPQSVYDRDFGYAYSELFIREYVSPDEAALRRVYNKLLEINESVSDPAKSNIIMENILRSKFQPCYSESLEDLKKCTKKLNEMSFKIPPYEGDLVNSPVEEIPLPRPTNASYFDYLSDLFSRIIHQISLALKSITQSFS